MADPILILDYDPNWPLEFERERDLIRAVLGGRLLAVEHIGSTAVPGLAAKPVVDLMGGMARLEDAAACCGPLQALSYRFMPEALAHLPDSRSFLKRPAGAQAFNLHLTVLDGSFWREKMTLRDYLRAHAGVAAEYAALKRRLAPLYRDVPFTYSVAKGEFIRKTLAQAKQEAR